MRELLLILGAIGLLVGSAVLVGKVARSLRDGFSVRLQIFLALALVAALLTSAFGLLVLDRLHDWAMEIAGQGASMTTLVEAFIRDFGPRLAALALVLGVGAACAALILGRGMARPLERLTRAAEAIARGERQAPLPPPVGREVRRLTAAFEQMRRALEDRNAIEEFVADLSHELKNPVSAIRAATEVLTEGAQDDPEARRRFLGRIDQASARLEVLLQDLLALARLEARGIGDEVQPLVAFDEIVRGAVEGNAARLEARQQRVDLDLAAASVRGSAPWMRRAVDNLLSNASRYGPEGSVIDVTLRAEGSWAKLRVHDRGPGVEEKLRARLFERYVTDRPKSGGTGLGLAIVRAVAEHHGGGVRLVQVESGACFEICLRLASRLQTSRTLHERFT